MPPTDRKYKPKIVTLTLEQVEEVFAQAQHQSDYLLGLYKLVYPDFDALASIDGFPAMGEALSELVWQRALEFDRVHHPECMNGGLLLNHGFSTDATLKPWQVKPCPVTYKDGAQAK